MHFKWKPIQSAKHIMHLRVKARLISALTTYLRNLKFFNPCTTIRKIFLRFSFSKILFFLKYLDSYIEINHDNKPFLNKIVLRKWIHQRELYLVHRKALSLFWRNSDPKSKNTLKIKVSHYVTAVWHCLGRDHPTWVYFFFGKIFYFFFILNWLNKNKLEKFH